MWGNIGVRHFLLLLWIALVVYYNASWVSKAADLDLKEDVEFGEIR